MSRIGKSYRWLADGARWFWILVAITMVSYTAHDIVNMWSK